MMNLSGLPLAEKPSSHNASFVVSTPSRAGIHQFHPDEMVAPIFGPNAPFWETSLGQSISQFGTASTVNVLALELTPNSRRPFPFLLPSDLLGRSLNIPCDDVPTNPPATPMVSRLSIPSIALHSTQNTFSNPHAASTSMPTISLSKFRSQFIPPTSQPTKGSYVSVIHNISHLPPLAVGPSGHVGIDPIGPAS